MNSFCDSVNSISQKKILEKDEEFRLLIKKDLAIKWNSALIDLRFGSGLSWSCIASKKMIKWKDLSLELKIRRRRDSFRWMTPAGKWDRREWRSETISPEDVEKKMEVRVKIRRLGNGFGEIAIFGSARVL